MEMQKMQKVTFTDVYFRDRTISFISKVNKRFLLVPCFCWSHVSARKRVERLKRVQKEIGYGISQREI